MTIQTATPTVRTAPLVLHAIFNWFKHPVNPTTSDSAHKDAVAKVRTEISEAGKKNFSGAHQKLLENALSDFSGI